MLESTHIDPAHSIVMLVIAKCLSLLLPLAGFPLLQHIQQTHDSSWAWLDIWLKPNYFGNRCNTFKRAPRRAIGIARGSIADNAGRLAGEVIARGPIADNAGWLAGADSCERTDKDPKFEWLPEICELIMNSNIVCWVACIRHMPSIIPEANRSSCPICDPSMPDSCKVDVWSALPPLHWKLTSTEHTTSICVRQGTWSRPPA